MIWLTADTHFGHKNIIRYCGRPFANTHYMDATIIDRWNEVVGKNDTVYHLGDVGWGDYRHCLRRLNGRIILIRGNHDKQPNAGLFVAVHDVYQLKHEHHRFWLSHYAHRTWPSKGHGTIHLYGHSHGTLPDTDLSMDVGVDVNDFRPVSIDAIMERFKGGVDGQRRSSRGDGGEEVEEESACLHRVQS